MPVDVVVNSANTCLIHTGGLSKAIAEAGGPAIKEESEVILRKHGRLYPGQAVHTTGGKMPCEVIIHAVGPSSNNVNHQSEYISLRDPYSQEENLLTDAVQNSLTLAEQLGYTSIVIPAISSGTMGFPLDLCTNTIVRAVDDWAENALPVDIIPLLSPLLVLGGLKFPGDVTAKIMYEEVIAYINDNPASSVSEIHFVVYDFPTKQ
ncbi:macro domain-containing protein TTE0995-like, partial [Saccoglossus kowalevskii]